MSTIAVRSVVGGAGTTTVAYLLAVELQARLHTPDVDMLAAWMGYAETPPSPWWFGAYHQIHDLGDQELVAGGPFDTQIWVVRGPSYHELRRLIARGDFASTDPVVVLRGDAYPLTVDDAVSVLDATVYEVALEDSFVRACDAGLLARHWTRVSHRPAFAGISRLVDTLAGDRR